MRRLGLFRRYPSGIKALGVVRRPIEQLLALLIFFETGGAARTRLIWPRVPESVFGATWDEKVDGAVEMVFSELEKLGLALHSRTLLKQNKPRLRFVFRTESRIGSLVIKIGLTFPLARFSHINSRSMEIFVHSEVARQVPNFIPNLVFGHESAIAVECIEGNQPSNFASNSGVLDTIVSSGSVKLRALHKSQTGSPYESADFSRDVNTLLDYWSQKRNPRWRDFWGSFGKLELRERSFSSALSKFWAGFNSYRSPPTSVLCAWDFNPDNFVMDRNQNLWMVDTEDFRFSLPVFDFAGFHSMAIEISENPEATFLNAKRSLIGLLGNDSENTESFWEMYEGLLAGHLIHAVFDSERRIIDTNAGRHESVERASFRFKSLRPIIEKLLSG